MDEPEKPGVDRRSFLTGAVTGAAAALIAQQTSVAGAQPAATTAEPVVQAGDSGRHASDFMVDIFKSLDMEYMFSMCASSFMGIHESVLNYAGNKSPQSITCTHEEISVAMANGYAKIEGKPVLVCAHATVGAQHAAMALYDAWCDRVPIYLVLGNTNDAADRQGEVFWLHSAQDPVRARARYDEVGRQPRVADPFRGIRRARVQDRDDAADGTRRDRRRREDAGRARSCRHADPEAEHPDAAGGRLRRDRRAREAARGGREPRHSRGPRRPHACRLGAHGGARRNAAGGRRRHAPTSELSDAPPLERRLAGSGRRRARARGRRHLERHAPSAATQRESQSASPRRISSSAATTKTSCAMPRSTCRSRPTRKRRCRH